MSNQQFPPLVTSQSPSYESAGREFRHPAPHGDAELTAALSVLCEVEHNAAAGFLAASTRVSSSSRAASLRHEAQTHQARRATLEEQVTASGGSAPTNEECRELLMFGASAIEDLPSPIADEAIMQVVDDMRGEIAEVYTKVRARPNLTEAQRSALSQRNT